MIQDIYIIDNTQSVLNVLKQIFKNDVDYQFSSVKTEELNFALKNIPDMIIIDEDTIDIVRGNGNEYSKYVFEFLEKIV